MAKRGYESQKTGRKVDELLDKIDNLNVPEWALQESKPSYTAQEVHALPENTSIPKKTSDLVNDRGFITQESDPTVPSWAKQPSKPTYTAEEVGALSEDTPIFSGDYNDLRNKPTIPTVPTDVSAFNNDAGYLTDEDMGDYATKQELNGKQDTINDLGSIRSGASAGATAYQKPQAGIPESDLSQGVKDKMNEKEVFWATYGTTTAAEIDAAVAAGKEVMLRLSSYTYLLTTNGDNSYIFTSLINGNNTTTKSIKKSDSTWSSNSVMLEVASNRVSSWQATPDNTHYPSEKLVKDSLDVKADLSSMSKWGVISQTLTKSGNDTIGYTLTPSDPVYGYIPQSFIDIVEGYFSFRYTFPIASFNETTGYFELNGITNIAYDEMLRIYNYGDIFRYYSSADMHVINILDGSDKFIGVRTLLPTEVMKNVISSFFRYCSIEVLRCSTFSYISVAQANIQYAFYNSLTYLREIQDEIRFITQTGSFNRTTSFRCPSLEKVTINKLPTSIAFLDSQNLSIESILYMINHENAPSAITITLHPTAYARAIADSDVQAALQAHTNVSLASAT